ncbi:MAG: GxxExxY protein [Planctomycetota bacterium]|jgi:GxxExxY protein|nr:GxxExxY protein [Planctomycetota bacterium]MDP7251256.1 GxxExxY protein [Planctomycetota bacterium]
MLYEDQTEQLIGGLFAVQNEVRTGKGEENYHQAYKIWLEENDIPYTSKKDHPVVLNRKVVHTLQPDIVVWDSIIIELKAKSRRLIDGDFIQLFEYLKYRGDRLGLLVNMGLDRVYFERVIYEQPEYALHENWDYWSGSIHGVERETGNSVREGLLKIFNIHGTGYGTEIVSKLIHSELEYRGLKFTTNPSANAFYKTHELGESTLECLVINEQLVLVFTALFDSNDFNISRGLSYLHALDMEWGIAVDFGKKGVRINGLRRRK